MFNYIMHLRWKRKNQIKCSENREQGKSKIKKKKVSLDNWKLSYFIGYVFGEI